MELLSQPLCKQGGRDKNQDFEKIHKLHTAGVTLHQFIVADGLGGQGGGEFASQAAVHSVLAGSAMHKNGNVGLDEYFAPEWLTLQFEIAHGNVKQRQQQQPEFSRMATTLVVLMVMEDKAIWGHVGDSRLYLFRDGKIHFQTRDHSVPQMLVSSGEIEEKDIRHHPDRNRLLRALGDNREKIQARVHEEVTLQEGDVFLLCSDGFWEYVTEDGMLASLYKSANPDDWLKRMESQYLMPATEEEARQEGKVKAENDNYTAIAVWYGLKPSPVRPKQTMEATQQQLPPYPKGIKGHARAVWSDFKQFVAPYVNTVFRKSDIDESHPETTADDVKDDPNDALLQPKAAPPKDWEAKQKEVQEQRRLEGITPKIHSSRKPK